MARNVKKKVIRIRSNQASLLEYAYDNRTDNFFNDVTVFAGGEYIKANRLILSCCSKYFEEKLKAVEPEDCVLDIPNIDGKTVNNIIDYIYSRKLTVDKENAFKLLSAANKLKITEVEQFCYNFIKCLIKNNTCFSILREAVTYDCKLLKKIVYRHISINYNDIPHTHSFKNLSEEELLSVFYNIDRNKVDNKLLYRSVVEWVHHNEETRGVLMSSLLNKLNISQLELQSNILQDDIITNDIGSSKFVLNELSPFLERKWIDEDGFLILSIGGVTISKNRVNKAHANVTVVHSTLDESLPLFPCAPVKVCAHCSLNLENVIYLIGGQTFVGSKSIIIDDVWQLSLLKKYLHWEKIASMKEKRWLCGASVFNDTIVASGGSNEKGRLSSVEIYRKRDHIWKSISNMEQPRSGHELVTCGDYLYAIGGWFEGNNSLTSVERLHGLSGKWEFVQPMKTGRRWFASVCWREEIYVFGGRSTFSTKSRLRTVEKYDPLVNQWFRVKKMKFKRNSHKACVLKDKIFLIGGIGFNGKVVKEIECFDPLIGTWTIFGELEDKLTSHSLIVL